MSEITYERLEKLPKWARDHIRNLEADKRRTEERLSDLAGSVQPDTRVLITDYIGEDVPLSDRDKVRFVIDTPDGKKSFIEIGFECRRGEKDYSMVTVRTADRPMVIQPAAANMAYVGCK